MKFSIKDFFSKWDQIRGKRQIWSYLLKKSLLGIFIFMQCILVSPFLPEIMKIDKSNKLLFNLYDKNNYVIHIRALRKALNH